MLYCAFYGQYLGLRSTNVGTVLKSPAFNHRHYKEKVPEEPTFQIKGWIINPKQYVGHTLNKEVGK